MQVGQRVRVRAGHGVIVDDEGRLVLDGQEGFVAVVYGDMRVIVDFDIGPILMVCDELEPISPLELLAREG